MLIYHNVVAVVDVVCISILLVGIVQYMLQIVPANGISALYTKLQTAKIAKVNILCQTQGT